MKIKANAKINLSLDVVSRRDDGYHELKMIMLPLELADEIEIELANQDYYEWNLDQFIDEKNTIVRAVELMRKQYNLIQHFKIKIVKNIPMQAGLGGGSNDAAAVMKAINELCELNVPLSDLAQLGKQIGADVPFGIINQMAVVGGVGEAIETFDCDFDYPIVLLKPKQGVSTKECFARLDYEQLEHPNIEKIKHAFINKDLDELASLVGNSLEKSACQLVPQIQSAKEDLISRGFEVVLMSGSGSCIYAISKDYERIRLLFEDSSYDFWFKVCTSVNKIQKAL